MLGVSVSRWCKHSSISSRAHGPVVGLLNVGIQLIHRIINARLTTITEAENLIVPGQDGGRAGRGVDLNQLKLDWITSESQRLKQRIIRIDFDFKNAFNSMSQSALWAVMRAYNLPDIDLLEAVYSRTTACMDPRMPGVQPSLS